MHILPLLTGLVVSGVRCINFPYEAETLTDADVGNFSAIAFGDKSQLSPTFSGPECKAFPGTDSWPLDNEWAQLNSSLGGALLKPSPPGIVCYKGPMQDVNACISLLFGSLSSRVYLDDPVTVLTTWPEGDTCPVTPYATGNCTQGGFPTYVVNATTVRHIQLAVNFARNKNLRLVIKNTGHDFVGRSTGAGALSVWTHWLKSFEFLPEYKQEPYDGMAARVGAGLEAWELYTYMDKYNMTVVVPGGSTVGAYGGWMAGGGHNTLSSSYGLGSDQALSLQVVTADGRFVTADPDNNSDLFYALRGGGPGTYGIVTSAIVKAYPPVYVSESALAFSVGNPGFGFGFGNFSFPVNGTNPFNFSNPFNTTGGFPNPFNVSSPFLSPFNMSNPFNFTIPGNFSFPNATAPATVNSTATFWKAVNAYFAFGETLCDAGGTGYSYLTPLGTGNTSFSFTTTLEMPGMTPQQLFDFVQPLFDDLNNLGVNVTNAMPSASLSWGDTREGEGDSPGNVRFASRLMPRSSWEDPVAFDAMMGAIRESIEAGYTFHGVQVAPTEKTAGAYPGPNTSSVNPAFRATLLHADLFDVLPVLGASVQVAQEAEARLSSYMNKWRAATPGAGAYINEADAQEPDWQQSFFGANYDRLLAIKRDQDPWGLFWAPTTVGSEAWEVRTADGAPTQNGRLCRVTS